MRIIYLHGFASGPGSRKAQVFKKRLEDSGCSVTIPRLDGGNFEGLTITGQYEILAREAAGESVTLIGSSMGGYLASLYAARHPEIDRLVLLAPAFDFQSRWPAMIGAEAFAAWKSTGKLQVYHYADNTPREVGWQLAEDALRWEPWPDFAQPALIFHGTGDTTVPIAASERFVAGHPNARLIPYSAGHELTEVVEEMWVETAAFLGLAEAGTNARQ